MIHPLRKIFDLLRFLTSKPGLLLLLLLSNSAGSAFARQNNAGGSRALSLLPPSPDSTAAELPFPQPNQNSERSEITEIFEEYHSLIPLWVEQYTLNHRENLPDEEQLAIYHTWLRTMPTRFPDDREKLASAHYLLACVEILKGNYENAVDEVYLLLNQNLVLPKEHFFIDELVNYLIKTGRYAESKDILNMYMYKKGVSATRFDVELYIHYADILQNFKETQVYIDNMVDAVENNMLEYGYFFMAQLSLSIQHESLEIITDHIANIYPIIIQNREKDPVGTLKVLLIKIIFYNWWVATESNPDIVSLMYRDINGLEASINAQENIIKTTYGDAAEKIITDTQYVIKKHMQKTCNARIRHIERLKRNIEINTFVAHYEKDSYTMFDETLDNDNIVIYNKKRMEQTQDYLDYARFFNTLAKIYFQTGKIEKAADIINFVFSYVKPANLELELYLEIYLAAKDVKNLENFLKHAVNASRESDVYGVELLKLYIKQNNFNEASNLCKKLFTIFPNSLEITKKYLEAQALSGDLTTLIAAGNYLTTLKPSEEQVLLIKGIMLYAMENYINDYPVLKKDIQAAIDGTGKTIIPSFHLLVNINSHIDFITYLFRNLQPPRQDATNNVAVSAGFLALVGLVTGGVYIYKMAPGRHKKQQEKSKRKILEAYSNMLLDIMPSHSAAPKNRTETKVKSDTTVFTNYTMAEFFGYVPELSTPYKKASKKRVPVSTNITEPSAAAPIQIETLEYLECSWEDALIPDYNPQNAALFIRVEKIHQNKPEVPTFFTITPEANDECGVALFLERMENRLKENPVIGAGNLVWRTYEKETTSKILEYKVRIRLKGPYGDLGLFARPAHAYDENRKKIATVWVFDKVRSHDQEEKENRKGSGVGKLVNVKKTENAPAATHRMRQRING